MAEAVGLPTPSGHRGRRLQSVRLKTTGERMKTGDTYFLSKVFLEGDEGGNQLLKSKMQRRLEENGSIAESHSIAASPALAKSSKRAVR